MTAEVPTDIGELSRYALREAIKKVDAALADAPEDVRKAVGVIRLVTDMPRRCPWYGVPVDPDDSSVTIGVVLRNLLGVYRDSEDYRRVMLRRLEQGKRDYNDFLDHLLDPERYRAEEDEPGLSHPLARQAWESVAEYRRFATEHGIRHRSGNMVVWDTTPETLRVFPLAERIETEHASGGTVYRRRVVVVEDWAEVPVPESERNDHAS